MSDSELEGHVVVALAPKIYINIKWNENATNITTILALKGTPRKIDRMA